MSVWVIAIARNLGVTGTAIQRMSLGQHTVGVEAQRLQARDACRIFKAEQHAAGDP